MEASRKRDCLYGHPVLAVLAALSGALSGTTTGTPGPPTLSYITVWVRDEELAPGAAAGHRLPLTSPKLSNSPRHGPHWRRFGPLANPESPDGESEVQVSLSGGRHWTLKWQPASDEAVFRLYGSGTPEMVDRSPMKLGSDAMLQLLQEWVGELVYPPPRPQ